MIAQSEINIAIGDRLPEQYLGELAEQVNGGTKRYGGIADEGALRANLAEHCVPANMLNGGPFDYEAFLQERRKLIAEKIRQWFEVLS